MRQVAAAERADFVELVSISGLDPKRDFRFANLRGVDLRGCDLREFDFRFADLSGAIVSESTLLPLGRTPEGLEDSVVEQSDEKPIAILMREIDATPEAQRAKLLEVLKVRYQSPKNVGEFCLNLLKTTRSPRHALQYISAMDEDYLESRSATLVAEIVRVLDLHSRKPFPRKKVGARTESLEAYELLEIIEAIGDEWTAEIAGDHRKSARTLPETIQLLKAGNK